MAGGKASNSQRTLTAVSRLAPNTITPLLHTLLLLNIQENAVAGGKASTSQRTLTVVPKLAINTTTFFAAYLAVVEYPRRMLWQAEKRPLHSGP